MILAYDFFQHALIGGLLASILCAMIGTYVVTRRLVIVGGGMAHASLGGVGLGAFFGINPLAGATVFALLVGWGVDFLTRRQVREDSAIAVLWTFGMAVGVLFAYLTPSFQRDLTGYLFGDILAITTGNLWFMAVLTVVTTAYFILLRNAIQTIAYDRSFAVTQGLPVRWLEYGLTILTALTIVCCLRMVGIIMVVSLLSLPQQTAALLTRSFGGMIWVSAIIGFLGIVGGLMVSYWLSVPCGATIVIILVVFYIISRIFTTLTLFVSRRTDR
ncbi:MAG: metal ABC transporter permease [Alloprevotella sp.]|nr:metal ABC transporter permease [Alloprevotella sp.]